MALEGVEEMAIRPRIVGVALLSVVLMSCVDVAAQSGGALQVTVEYTGADGEVNATNAIVVMIFSDPPTDESALPMGFPLIVQENGATVTFENIAVSPVYLLAALMDPEDLLASAGVGLPSGTPMGLHGMLTGAPVGIAIGDGDTVEVALQFDDLVRMP